MKIQKTLIKEYYTYYIMHFNSENKLHTTKGRVGLVVVFKEQAISKQNTERG